MNGEALSQRAAVSKPPTVVLARAPLLEFNKFLNYARLWRKLDKQSATNLIHRRKSQTVSGQSRKVLFVAWPVLRKVRTASAQFNATKLRSLEQKDTKITKNLDGIPVASIELPVSKIQTLSGEFRRRRLRNLRSIASAAAIPARGGGL